MKCRILNVLSLSFNVVIAILVTYSVFTFFVSGGDGNMEVTGFKCFRYFTVLSNVLVSVMSVIFAIYNIKFLKSGISNIPSIPLLCKFIGTVSVTVTFLTVLFFLGPTLGYSLMFEGVNLFLHAIVPIMAIISFVMFEVNKKLLVKQCLFGLIPTIIYSIVYVIMVVFIKEWEDFYGFTFGGKLYLAPVSLVMMYIATLLFSFGLVYLHNKCCIIVKKEKD